jgi:iron(III) transport system permease protein
VGAGILALLILFPVVSVLFGLTAGGSETWTHLRGTVLSELVVNSLLLTVLTGVLTLALGIPSAWVVSTTDFPGRKLFEWALVLPLAIPTYIAAFTYAELFSHQGILEPVLSLVFHEGQVPRIRSTFMSLPGVSVVLAVVLYPYVYLVSRASFLKQSGGVLEMARTLGRSPSSLFLRVALPLARPGIVAGLLLVLMEVLNEYGAVKYFGVPTFTTGIFRAWFSLGDTPAALRLSAWLLALILLLVLLERGQRGRARFDDSGSRPRPARRISLGRGMALGALLLCVIPVTLGFVIPTLQLLKWGLPLAGEALEPRFLRLVAHSFGLALLSAGLVVSAAVLLVYAARLSPSPTLRGLVRLSGFGYAIPGAVVAVGILIPFLWVDRNLALLLRSWTGASFGLLLTGTLVALVFAYLVRFLAVALNPVEAGFERVCGNLDESARALGASPMRTLFRIDLPLLRPTLFSAGILVFVDVLKELPLTLLLRPFDFDTLATRAFQLASDEQIARSAVPALLILAVGLLPVLILSRLSNPNSRQGDDAG